MSFLPSVRAGRRDPGADSVDEMQPKFFAYATASSAAKSGR